MGTVCVKHSCVASACMFMLEYLISISLSLSLSLSQCVCVCACVRVFVCVFVCAYVRTCQICKQDVCACVGYGSK